MHRAHSIPPIAFVCSITRALIPSGHERLMDNPHAERQAVLLERILKTTVSTWLHL